MALLFLSVAIDPYAQLKKWREADQAGPGTLYGAIPRLERQGWIEPLWPEERR
jgi:DNA-binding PadR family transcriptional regulator